MSVESGTEAKDRTVARKDKRAPVTQRRGLMLRARLVLFWEALWPILIGTVTPLFLMVVAGLLGLWRVTPMWVHWLAMAVSLASMGVLAFLAARGSRAQGKWATKAAALARLEEDGAVRFDALKFQHDKQFGGSDTLWRAHRAAMSAEAAKAAVRGPRASGDHIDPFGLRFLTPGLLAIALVVAGEESGIRFKESFNPIDPALRKGGVADLWIEPPAYTRAAPIYLLRSTENLVGDREQISAPVGSTIIMQGSPERRYGLRFHSESGIVDAKGEAGVTRRELTLTGDGVISLATGGGKGRWPVEAIPDRPPIVTYIDEPSPTDDSRLTLSFLVDDDYGVTAATLHMKLAPDQSRPLDAPAIDETSLAEERIITIEGAAGGPGERRNELDLQADPWAGLVVLAKIAVTDGAGQTAQTPSVEITLPERAFYNPLARAVIEQRQTLAVAQNEWRRAEWAFSGLTLGPGEFYDNPSEYLLMRTAMWRVAKEAGGDYSETVADFWPLALQLEDEALELARQRLEAAKEALREALERGASDAELEQLTEELRAAMQQYLQALAESGASQPHSGSAPSQSLSAEDLESMLDSIRDLAQSGARNAAQQALNELENILNNLSMSNQQAGQQQSGAGQSGQSSGGQDGEGNGAGAAADLIGRQRALSNEAFERGEQQGAVGEDLARAQDDLADDLQSLLNRAPMNDTDESRMARQSLGDALEEMRSSESALSEDEFDRAGDAMNRAIARLREGAEAMARDEQRQAQLRRGQQGDQPGGVARDPLGRPIGDAYGQAVEVPGQRDAQRAREYMEELRRRLSTGERTEEEIDYLERLLERF